MCLFQLQEGEEFTAATSGGLLIAGKSSWPSYMFTFKLFLSIPIYSIRSYIHHCRHHRAMVTLCYTMVMSFSGNAPLSEKSTWMRSRQVQVWRDQRGGLFGNLK